MSITDNLNNLQTNIENAKSILVNNLTEKGVTSATTSSTLTVLATSVADIPNSGGGGNPFEEIGYTETPQYIQDGIDYAKEIYDNWDASVTDRSGAFSGETELVYFPKVDTSNVTEMRSLFYGCSNLQYVPELDTSAVTNMSRMFRECSVLRTLDLSSFDTSNVTNMSAMFERCGSLTSVDVSNWDISNVTTMERMFEGCNNLTSLDLNNWDTSKVTNMSNMFYECKNLEKVDGYISFKSYSSSTMDSYYLIGYSKNTSIKKITFKDIGYNTNAKQFNMSYAENWGVNTDTIPDARQSLTDSLITYSFDRATAGYSTCTVKLHSTTKALLTEDEIAQITAKGFTIA